jgi:hypothetical protein
MSRSPSSRSSSSPRRLSLPQLREKGGAQRKRRGKAVKNGGGTRHPAEASRRVPKHQLPDARERVEEAGEEKEPGGPPAIALAKVHHDRSGRASSRDHALDATDGAVFQGHAFSESAHLSGIDRRLHQDAIHHEPIEPLCRDRGCNLACDVVWRAKHSRQVVGPEQRTESGDVGAWPKFPAAEGDVR